MKCRNLIFAAGLGCLVPLLWGACKKTPQKAAEPLHPVVGDVQEIQSVEERDTTIYGVAGDFGMSTFSLITDAGDTLLMTRSAEDGTDGVIYGEAKPGDRYALITRDDGDALVKAINLTQLELHTKNYRIQNGHLILHPEAKPETVRIERLNANAFEYTKSDGSDSTGTLRVASHELVVK
ncbi:MAG: hypothetical protein IJ244_01630 [Bacteroidaceae bacterium]|nr:hypothetical protein [Bacteroidaceae bacterium]